MWRGTDRQPHRTAQECFKALCAILCCALFALRFAAVDWLLRTIVRASPLHSRHMAHCVAARRSVPWAWVGAHPAAGETVPGSHSGFDVPRG